MHRFIVFSVAFVCSTAIELKAMRTVMSKHKAQYSILPAMCCTHLTPFASRVGVLSCSSGPVLVFQIVLAQEHMGNFEFALGV